MVLASIFFTGSDLVTTMMAYPLGIGGACLICSVIGTFFVRLGASESIMGALYKGCIVAFRSRLVLHESPRLLTAHMVSRVYASGGGAVVGQAGTVHWKRRQSRVRNAADGRVRWSTPLLARDHCLTPRSERGSYVSIIFKRSPNYLVHKLWWNLSEIISPWSPRVYKHSPPSPSICHSR